MRERNKVWYWKSVILIMSLFWSKIFSLIWFKRVHARHPCIAWIERQLWMTTALVSGEKAEPCVPRNLTAYIYYVVGMLLALKRIHRAAPSYSKWDVKLHTCPMIPFAILLPAVAQSPRMFAMNHPIGFLFSNLEHVTQHVAYNLQRANMLNKTKIIFLWQ